MALNPDRSPFLPVHSAPSRSVWLVFALGALMLMPAPRTMAQKINPVEPYYVAVTKENVPLKCRDGDFYYPVAVLKAAQVLRVDGQNEAKTWLRVEYPAGLSAFVKSDDGTLEAGGKTLKLTRPSRLNAASTEKGDTANWWTLLDQDKELAPGTKLSVVQTLTNAAGKAYGYHVAAPKEARGYVRAEFVRPATAAEAEAAARAAGAAAPPVPVAPKPAPPSPGAADKAAPKQAEPVKPVVTPAPAPTPFDQPKPTSPPAAERPVTPVTPPTRPADGATRPATVPPIKASLQTLVSLFDRAVGKSMDLPELEAVIAEFQRYLDALGDSPADKRIASQLTPRLEVLKMRAELRGSLARVRESGQTMEKESARVKQEVARLDALREYAVVGRLVPSTVYDGERLPLMYRVASQDTGNPRTLGYVRPNPGMDLATKVGKIVGVVGSATFDEALRVNIVTPDRVDVLSPPAKQGTAAPGAAPPVKEAAPGAPPENPAPAPPPTPAPPPAPQPEPGGG